MRNLNNLINKVGESFFEFQSKLQFFEREYLRKYEIVDVTPTEVKVLYIIGLSNTKSMSDIADQLRITKGTLSITVNSLVKKGYVIRNRHKQDRRVIILYLTRKSISIVKHYEKFYTELLRGLFSELSEEKIPVVDEILEKLNIIIESNFYENVLIYEEDGHTNKENNNYVEENEEIEQY
jgi:DNA-binding MarR family transcriptional regulator